MAAVTMAAVTVASTLVAPAPAAAADRGADRDVEREVEREVDVFTGSGGTPPFFSGNTSPAASRPFGMVQLGPDTTADPGGAPSAGASGYRADEPLVRGFSPLHLSGAGCPAFGDVPLLPVTGALPADPGAATVAEVAGSERASPGRYAVRLANGVSASMAADARSGLLSFGFPRGARGRLLVKAEGSLAGTSSARVRVVGPREVAVSATSGGFCGARNAYRVHVLLRLDQPVRRRGSWDGGLWVAAGRDGRVRVQVGVSFVSVAGARRNLDADDPGWAVRRLAREAAREWDATLDRVRVRGGTSRDRGLFDTALYRVFQYPSTISDADGRYPGLDGRTHRLRAGERQLSSVSGWDYYRTHAPLLAWVRPEVAAEVVRSLLRDARQGGRLPRWPIVDEETGIMSGDPAAPAIASTYAFGGRDFDLRRAVTALARQGDTVRDDDGFEPRPGLRDYLSRGYVVDPVLERGRLRSHGASTTLEYALADFAISRLATAAGRDDVAARYRHRSRAWTRLVDPSRDLVLPRDASGSFPPADAVVTACCSSGFDEGNALQYTWGGVPHDVAGLLRSLGPASESIERLDTFFSRLNAGGDVYAWLGNQPSLGTPWVYHWLGLPARTQDVVARARAELWAPGPEGLPGNDDLGALSAWYVWASMGLYPVTPGTATVALGVPAFTRVTVRPTTGGRTRVLRVGTGTHVGAVAVDGVAQSRSWLTLGPRRAHRTVVVTTTGAAQPAWGTAPGDAPPSYPAS